MNIQYKIAKTKQDFKEGTELFRQYAHSQSLDLSFQNFLEELEFIDKQYNEPKGGLLLSKDNQKAVGCMGIKKWNSQIAEIKRMFIQAPYWGNCIGVTLLQLSLDLAINLGYKKVRLDMAGGYDCC